MPGTLRQAIDATTAEALRARGSYKWSAPGPDGFGAAVAEMDFGAAPAILESLAALSDEANFGYLPPFLADELAEACADFQQRRFGWDVDPALVHHVPDVLKALELAITQFSRPGAPVILPTPAYMPFLTVPGFLGREIIQVRMRDEAGFFTFDLDAIEDAFRAGGNLLIFCNPYNPLGRVVTREEMTQLTEVVDRHGGRVFADEIHAALVYPGLRHIPYASTSQAAAAHTLTATSASKAWNLPGLKCAQVILSNAADKQRWEEMGFFAAHGASNPGVVANIAAYRHGQAWLDEVVAYLDDSRQLLAGLLRRHLPQVRYRPPDGTYLAWLDCTALDLLGSPGALVTERARVTVVDGTACGEGGQGAFRLNFATPQPILTEMVEHIAAALGQGQPVTAAIRTAIRVEGVVQGVGFRPFVYAVATSLGLSGFVGNDVDGVFVEVEGPAAAVREFLVRLERDPPPLARIERVTTRAVLPTGSTSFAIAASDPGGPRRTLVSADTATCADCLRELADPADRRFGYPFINCTNCGPRFTIVRDVPYDRPLTTMAPFAMCERCAAEYHDPADRRFHAQPTCCPACGPRLILRDATGRALPGAPVARAAELLGTGQVLAVKGLGGYHLAVDAACEQAAAALRARKHREDKPFAVLVADLAAARRLCQVEAASADLMTSASRPIVLLPRRPGVPVAAATAPGNRQLGIMLPYTPLHHLLIRATARPIVLTSGNVSDEPIAYHDADALERLGGIADAFLTHDRAIHIRTDDSVARTFRGRPMLIRRSRGYVPEPVTVARPFRRPVLACGAELKNTFCLAKDGRAFISHHIGDLENAETLRSFTEGIEHFRRLFDIDPQVVAHDLHPEYLSTKYALELAGVDLEPVQHHHAHVASCLADNDADGPVIGVAFDGTGYGADGTIWGGEFLVADLASYQRGGHLAPVPMPGGSAAIRQPWRMAAAYLATVVTGAAPDRLDVMRRNQARWPAVVAMAERGVNSPQTSSAGRLFDAAASILGVRDAINYEGQAGIELEQLADREETGAYRARIEPGEGPFQACGADLLQAIVDDLTDGVPAPVIAARFHHGIAALIEAGCLLLRERTGLGTVALSGGVFQNTLLLHGTVARLEARGFTVLVHSRVPCNDGGISLGQAVIAGARDRLQ